MNRNIVGCDDQASASQNGDLTQSFAPPPNPFGSIAPGIPAEHVALALQAAIRHDALSEALRFGSRGAHSDTPRALISAGHFDLALLWDAAAECLCREHPLTDQVLLAVAAELRETTREYAITTIEQVERLVDNWFADSLPDERFGRDALAAVLEHFLVDRPLAQGWSRWLTAGGEPPRSLEHRVSEIRDLIETFRQNSSPRGPFTTSEFRQLVGERVELIRGILIGGLLMLVAAPTKSLKTLICLDAAISLVSGTCFLGNAAWACLRPQRVGFFSAESGAATLLAKHDLIARAKRESLPAERRELFDRLLTENLLWQDQLPDLGDATAVTKLCRVVERLQITVLFLDPLSMAIGSAAKDLANLAIGGQVLLRAAHALQRVGCTLILVHHTAGDRQRRSSAQARQFLELSDVAYPSIANHARQWLTINRAAPYDAFTRCSELCLHVGGSGGQVGGNFRVTVVEGQEHDQWRVSVTGEAAHIEARRELAQREQGLAELDRDRRVLAFVRLNPGATINAMVRNTSELDGLGARSIERALSSLQSRRAVRSEPGSGGHGGWHPVEVMPSAPEGGGGNGPT